MDKGKYNDKYFELLRTLLIKLNNGKDNTVFSPFSVMMLLAIAADATTGKTREEITNAICGDMNFEELKETIASLQKKITKDESLRSASAVIVREDIGQSIVKGYEERLEKDFNGKLFAAKDMVSAVNSWVNDKTNGRIPAVADDSMKDMLFSLINAIAFEAEWEREYEDTDIINDDFTNADGTVSRVKMLESGEGTYLENKAFEGFIKPYKDSGFSYVALLPKRNNGRVTDNAVKSLDPASFRVNPEAIVEVIMPEFSCSLDEKLTPFLSELGIKIIFTNKADFSPLSTEWLKGGMIIHKARIEVDRNGTKAAAVSFMPGFAGAAPDMSIEYRQIRLDRPFIYAVVHNNTGLPIFVGTINHLEPLTGDDLMTNEEMWAFEEKLISQLQGAEYDGIFELGRDTDEYEYYKRIRTACVKHDGKEMRKLADEVADFLKNK